jgi:hypothetical protein
VADHNRLIHTHRIDHAHNILGQAGEVVTSGRRRGPAVPTPRHGQHAVTSRQQRRKIVEDMRRITKAGQQDDRRTRATPIENLQLHIGIDGDQRHDVRRGVLPIGLL